MKGDTETKTWEFVSEVRYWDVKFSLFTWCWDYDLRVWVQDEIHMSWESEIETLGSVWEMLRAKLRICECVDCEIKIPRDSVFEVKLGNRCMRRDIEIELGTVCVCSKVGD